MEEQSVLTTESKVRTKRSLGGTSVKVTPIGLGAWQFSHGKGGAIGSWSALTEQITDEIVGVALEGGIKG